MLFKEYNDNLAAAVRAGGNFRSAIFDEVANITDKPDRSQLMDFLTKLSAAINLETGRYGGVKDLTQVGARSTAIGHIFNFVDNGGGGVFSNVDKYAFAFQLALRVRSPAVINQDQTTLCGPVAMIYDIAKRDPVRYAQFAISLFTTGAGQLGPSQIAPSMRIRSGYQQGLMPEVDYVVLASIRDSDAIILALEPIRNILTLTKPGALCEFMRRAGFSNIADHSFLTLSMPLRALNAVTPFGLHGTNHNSYDQGLLNLQNMNNQLNTLHRFIVMNADVQVAAAFVSGQSFQLAARPDPLPAAETHWTAVRKLRIAGDNVRMKIVTWGGTYEGTVKKAALLSRYAGFVSADP